MEFETIIHATQFNEYFELNHTEHKVNRLHSDSSLLADIEYIHVLTKALILYTIQMPMMS